MKGMSGYSTFLETDWALCYVLILLHLLSSHRVLFRILFYYICYFIFPGPKKGSHMLGKLGTTKLHGQSLHMLTNLKFFLNNSRFEARHDSTCL